MEAISQVQLKLNYISFLIKNQPTSPLGKSKQFVKYLSIIPNAFHQIPAKNVACKY